MASDEDMEDVSSGTRANDYYVKGMAYVGKQDYFTAMCHFSRAIFLLPDEAVLYVARAETCVNLCDLKSAVSNYKKAISLQSQPDPAYRNRLAAILDSLGLLNFNNGRFEAALTYFTTALQHTPSNKVVLLHRSLALFMLRKVKEAVADAKACETVDLCQPWTWVAQGVYFLISKNFVEAKEVVEKALLVAPECPQVIRLETLFDAVFDRFKGEAITHMENEQWESAQKILDQCIAAFQHDPELYKIRSKCHSSMRKYTSAVQDLFECINKSGMADKDAARQLAHTLVLIARELVEKGNYESAINYCVEALRWDGNMVEALLTRGRCYQELDQHENAFRDFKKILEISPDHGDGRWSLAALHNRWGTLLHNDGKYNMAEHEFRRAISYEPDVALFHFNLAKSLMMLQQPTEAIRELVKCRDLGPTTPAMWNLILQFCPPDQAESTGQGLRPLGNTGILIAPSPPTNPVQKLIEQRAAEGRKEPTPRKQPVQEQKQGGRQLVPIRVSDDIFTTKFVPEGKGAAQKVLSRRRCKVMGNEAFTKKMEPMAGYEMYTSFKSGENHEIYHLRKEKSVLKDPYGVMAVRDVAAMTDKTAVQVYGKWHGSGMKSRTVVPQKPQLTGGTKLPPMPKTTKASTV
eukprot:Sspe_Gene.44712::Locus_21950_Transcript_1_1_Confidence_1.000_Length_2050::g.44712::m.44712